MGNILIIALTLPAMIIGGVYVISYLMVRLIDWVFSKINIDEESKPIAYLLLATYVIGCLMTYAMVKH